MPRSVIPRELVATARVPGHGGELRCYRHDGAFQLWIDRTELMSSRVHESEQMLAEVGCAHLAAKKAPRVLVGGLGMGFTLATVLKLAPADAVVVVVELVPEVVQWNRELFGHLAGNPLQDARVQVQVGDVFDTMTAAKAAKEPFDAILLDVDNGPEALVHPRNTRLYASAGLVAARDVLAPGGMLAVWSSTEVPSFEGRMKGTGFTVTTHRTRARGRKGPRRTIWTAQRRGT